MNRGQLLRTAQVEGAQTGDLLIINAHDYKEHFHVGTSLELNLSEGIGDMRHLTKLYSQPSRENVMLTVVKDTTKVHYAWSSARCSPRIYELRYHSKVPPHRSCQTNLAEVIAPYGISADDVSDVYNLFMNVEVEGARTVFRPPVATKDDYVDFKAEMDLLVALSSCPSDLGIVNSGKIKPLKMLVFENV